MVLGKGSDTAMVSDAGSHKVILPKKWGVLLKIVKNNS